LLKSLPDIKGFQKKQPVNFDLDEKQFEEKKIIQKVEEESGESFEDRKKRLKKQAELLKQLENDKKEKQKILEEEMKKDKDKKASEESSKVKKNWILRLLKEKKKPKNLEE